MFIVFVFIFDNYLLSGYNLVVLFYLLQPWEDVHIPESVDLALQEVITGNKNYC